MYKVIFFFFVFSLVFTTAQAVPLSDETIAFADHMHEKYGMDAANVSMMIQNAELLSKVLENMDKPFERSTWGGYKKGMVVQSRSDRGAIFFTEHEPSLWLAYAQFGVDPAIITAILGVETNYGDYKLKYRSMDALATLGFYYPKRSKYFLSELEALIIYADKNGIDPFSLKSSYAGAIGIPQFMPSNITKHGVDYGGDNLVDLVNSKTDAIGSVANYLKNFGWQRDKPCAIKVTGSGFEKFITEKYDLAYTVDELKKGGVIFPVDVNGDEKTCIMKLEGENGDEYWAVFNNLKVIMKYNKSVNYAMAVLLLSKDINVKYVKLLADRKQ